MPELILASASPQRRAILSQLGVAFEAVSAEVEELTEGPPEEVVLENAHRKAAAVARRLGAGSAADPRLVLGVDTEVALGGRVHGKPADGAAARAMLALLSGRKHRVLSGLCVVGGGRVRTAAAVTTVSFRVIDDATLDWYLAADEWRGRAGGYAIQGRGAALVKALSGDYLNVVGLPVSALLDLVPDLLLRFSGVGES